MSGKKIQAGGVGLFFYAGHGMQVKGKNYLIPVGADITAEDEIPDEAVEADLILRKMESARNGMNVVILDACRNNPYARSFRSSATGLARMNAPKGTLIAYSTGPGSVAADGDGRNSPYTKHLLTQMQVPGQSIEQTFKRVRMGVLTDTGDKQTPWESSSLVGDFWFVPGFTPHTNTYSMTIQTTPSDALVQLTSSDHRYKDGIRLESGRHDLKVSRRGYKTFDGYVNLDKDSVWTVKLESETPSHSTSASGSSSRSWTDPTTDMEFVKLDSQVFLPLTFRVLLWVAVSVCWTLGKASARPFII